jgi:uncharacterized protein (DUF4415 family)
MKADSGGKAENIEKQGQQMQDKVSKSPPSGNRGRGTQSHFARFGLATRQFMKKLNKKQKKQIAAIAAKKDADIDLIDMPEVLDWSKAEIGKFYRPAKKPVTIRMDTDIIT